MSLAVERAGITTLWQVQRLDQARQAIAAGTDILVPRARKPAATVWHAA
jgi:hypothetical protein